MSNTTKHRLVGWGTFEDLSTAILARTFGVMVELSLPVVKEYHSDLFHDSTWLRENVKGEMTFDFVVRTSGTHVGDSAKYGITSPGAVGYRMTLRADTRGRDGTHANADWWLDVTQVENFD